MAICRYVRVCITTHTSREVPLQCPRCLLMKAQSTMMAQWQPRLSRPRQASASIHCIPAVCHCKDRPPLHACCCQMRNAGHCSVSITSQHRKFPGLNLFLRGWSAIKSFPPIYYVVALQDVTAFLSWAAEPEHDDRKLMGVKWIFVLSLVFLTAAYYKRWKWAPIKSRRVVVDALN